MNHARRSALLLLALGLLLLPLDASAQDLDAALAAIKGYTFGDSREGLVTVEALVTGALASPSQRRAAAAKLTHVLGTDATNDCKLFVCRQLAIAAGPENVSAIAPLLHDAATTDMARYALRPIPGSEADKAYLDALSKGPEEARPGVINDIGERGITRAVTKLGKIAGEGEGAAAEAAIAALGKIGTKSAARKLASIEDDVAVDLRPAVENARLAAAIALAESGREEAAENIYEDLAAPGRTDRVRVAAFLGMVNIEEDEAMEMIMEALDGTDAPLRAAAKRCLYQMAEDYEAIAAAH